MMFSELFAIRMGVRGAEVRFGADFHCYQSLLMKMTTTIRRVMMMIGNDYVGDDDYYEDDEDDEDDGDSDDRNLLFHNCLVCHGKVDKGVDQGDAAGEEKKSDAVLQAVGDRTHHKPDRWQGRAQTRRGGSVQAWLDRKINKTTPENKLW